MSELTREQAIAEHRKMWAWIAENCNEETGKDIWQLKKDYVEANNLKDILNNCFCCAYAKQENNNCETDMCWCCPLNWGCPPHEGMYYCEKTDEDSTDDGLWVRALDLSSEGNFKEAKKLALEIANLPEQKEEV